MLKDELLSILSQKGYSERVIKAFEKVKREEFAPEILASYAYEDIPLPIWTGATISQPSTIAFMLDLLDARQGQNILELGSGSGYVLALLSEIIKDGKISGVEINKKLALNSRKTLSKNSIIQVVIRSGSSGLPESAPYDRILVSFSCHDRYFPALLVDQLKDPGILVVPIKQSIFQFKKENGKVSSQEFPGFAFVPMVQKEG